MLEKLVNSVKRYANNSKVLLDPVSGYISDKVQPITKYTQDTLSATKQTLEDDSKEWSENAGYFLQDSLHNIGHTLKSAGKIFWSSLKGSFSVLYEDYKYHKKKQKSKTILQRVGKAIDRTYDVVFNDRPMSDVDIGEYKFEVLNSPSTDFFNDVNAFLKGLRINSFGYLQAVDADTEFYNQRQVKKLESDVSNVKDERQKLDESFENNIFKYYKQFVEDKVDSKYKDQVNSIIDRGQTLSSDDRVILQSYIDNLLSNFVSDEDAVKYSSKDKVDSKLSDKVSVVKRDVFSYFAKEKTDEFRQRAKQNLDNFLSKYVEGDNLEELFNEKYAEEDTLLGRVFGISKFDSYQKEKQKILDDLMPEAFALAQKSSGLVYGKEHFDEQIMGAAAMSKGKMIQLASGEGKTLTGVLAGYLSSMLDKVHVATTNDYLAIRDSAGERNEGFLIEECIGDLYRFLGLSVGYNPQELNSENELQERARILDNDVIFGTLSSFIFTDLRNEALSYDELGNKIKIPYGVMMLDESDMILAQESTTPHIISSEREVKGVEVTNQVIQFLQNNFKTFQKGRYSDEEINASEERRNFIISGGDYVFDKETNDLEIKASGIEKLKQLQEEFNDSYGKNLDLSLFVGKFRNTILANNMDKNDYNIIDGNTRINDQSTGRLKSENLKYRDGLAEAIEAISGEIKTKQTKTRAQTTIPLFLQKYSNVVGMTGTVDEKLNYGLNKETVKIPTHFPRAFTVDRKLYQTQNEKLEAIVKEAKQKYDMGMPVLVISEDNEFVEKINQRLDGFDILVDSVVQEQKVNEALLISQSGKPYSGLVSNNMAGRGTNIEISLDDIANEVIGKIPQLDKSQSVFVRTILDKIGDRQYFDQAKQVFEDNFDNVITLHDELTGRGYLISDKENLDIETNGKKEHNFLVQKLKSQSGSKKFINVFYEGEDKGRIIFYDNQPLALKVTSLKDYKKIKANLPNAVGNFIKETSIGKIYSNFENHNIIIPKTGKFETDISGIIEKDDFVYTEGKDEIPIKTTTYNLVSGLHVILAEQQKNKASEEQALNRAARFGSPGSATIYTSLDEGFLRNTAKLIASSDDFIKMVKDGDVLDLSYLNPSYRNLFEELQEDEMKLTRSAVLQSFENDKIIDRYRKEFFEQRDKISKGFTLDEAILDFASYHYSVDKPRDIDESVVKSICGDLDMLWEDYIDVFEELKQNMSPIEFKKYAAESNQELYSQITDVFMKNIFNVSIKDVNDEVNLDRVARLSSSYGYKDLLFEIDMKSFKRKEMLLFDDEAFGNYLHHIASPFKSFLNKYFGLFPSKNVLNYADDYYETTLKDKSLDLSWEDSFKPGHERYELSNDATLIISLGELMNELGDKSDPKTFYQKIQDGKVPCVKNEISMDLFLEEERLSKRVQDSLLRIN